MKEECRVKNELCEYVRKLFPSLQRETNGNPIAYLDGPGGYQVPESVMQAVTDYFVTMNANEGDQFETAQKTSEMIQNARSLFADFFHCTWDEVVFGANMTTLNMALAQALMREMTAGDRVLITEIDHEANRGPWLQLRERGIVVDEVAIDVETCTIDMKDFEEKVARKPKVVALNYASNGVGTINEVNRMIRLSHAVGAWTVVDAVHYAAHGPLDVKELATDFLLCSAYKFFGPHIGVMYGRKELLERLRPLNLRTQHQYPPFMMETGTLHHEGIAGAAAAVKFIAEMGARFGHDEAGETGKPAGTMRDRIVAGLLAFERYERTLTEHLINGVASELPGVRVYGPPKGWPRTSTVSFTCEGYHSDHVARYLGSLGLFVWGGHFYAFRLVERLGLLDQGGLVRIGIAPYNTKDELERLVAALRDQTALSRFVDAMG
jgi:cysteine desulfurase family protein (TIGR01976 family)